MNHPPTRAPRSELERQCMLAVAAFGGNTEIDLCCLMLGIDPASDEAEYVDLYVDEARYQFSSDAGNDEADTAARIRLATAALQPIVGPPPQAAPSNPHRSKVNQAKRR